MKIICENCGAKYSIADEKVKGKVFKIRCKKCQESIVIRGDQPAAEPAPAPAPVPAPAAPEEEGEAETRVFDYSGYQSGGGAEEAVWHVAVDGGEQQGPYTTQQLGEYIASGNIDYETFIWREGFSDWKAVRDVDEVMAIISGQEPAAAGGGALESAPAAAAAGGGLFDAAPAEPASGGLFDTAPAEPAGGGGLFDSAPADPGAGGGGLFDSAPAEPDAAPGGGLFGGGADDANPGDVFSSTPAADTSTGGLFSADQSAAADAGGGGLFDAGEGAAAGGGGDLFSGDSAEQDGGGIFASTEAPGGPRVSAEQAAMTGQRNENSVLFSLSNLQALASGGAPAPGDSGGGGGAEDPAVAAFGAAAPAAGSPGAGYAGGEASGLIDIRAMASSLNAEAEKSSDVDDMLSLGGGGFAPTLGAPVLAASAPAGMSMGAKIGIAAGVLVVLIGAVVGGVFFLQGDDKSAQDEKIKLLVQQLEDMKKGGGSAEDVKKLQAQISDAQGEEKPEQGKDVQQLPDEDAETAAEEGSGKSPKKSGKRSGKSSKPKSSDSGASSSAPSGDSKPAKSSSSGKKNDALDDLLGGSKKKPKKTSKPKKEASSGGSEKLSRSQVISGMNAVKSSVKRCGAGKSGSVKVRAVISPAGRVTSATPTGTFAGTTEGSCAARAVKRAKFPSAGKSTTVTYPFKF